MKRFNMTKYEMSFGRLMMVALGCYFAFVIYRANNKLQSEKIGTIFSTVSKKNVQAIYLSYICEGFVQNLK